MILYRKFMIPLLSSLLLIGCYTDNKDTNSTDSIPQMDTIELTMDGVLYEFDTMLEKIKAIDSVLSHK